NFVVRSSSNAEDLAHFPAAGIYESYNHLTLADTIFESIKKVWASLVSPRSVHLREEVGIPLDDCYMGVIIQEEISCQLGGVMVTSNPMNPSDFRNVYINASSKSAVEVVTGTGRPYQMLYSIVEGGGRTLLKDAKTRELKQSEQEMLQNLAICGKLLQSHYSPDYSFDNPVDIEWAIRDDQIYILQIRPYQGQ
ncbi:PEP/pyruvate-binding domain-containing protein, partial [Bacteriovoracaceae bacterium]|nr:PEP/pyruvate-binding domain-containing protein [Bacteriovoracaceae bacterium]